MKLSVGLLLATGALGNSFHTSDYKEKFVAWAKEHSKEYDVVEFFQRFSNFKKAMDFVVDHNSGDHGYSVHLNKFADMTNEEFRTQFNKLQKVNEATNVVTSLENATGVPSEVDWVSKGAVTPVKNQGQCGSCWAFSTTGALEGAHFVKHGELLSLSEQELVDCSASQGNHGCNGGLMDFGFTYAEGNGICAESEYAYEGVVGECRASSCTKVARVQSYNDVPRQNLDALAAAAANQPVSIAVDAGGLGWQLYHSGVYKSTLFNHCGTQLDHGVLLVGYGTDSSDGAYWKVKNSWGPAWGESGFIRLQKKSGRGAGMCGLALSASYPEAL